MKTVTLDVETSLSEPWTEEGFPPLPLHVPEIVCWLVAQDGQDLQLHICDRATMIEGEMLGQLSHTLDYADRLVTWNGRSFDMPLLSLRALANDVDWSFWEHKRHRFPNYKTPLFHFDMMEQLGDYGAARGLSLDRVARLVGLPGKVGIDGAEVGAALARGERKRVADYCCNDVFETFMVYLRWSGTHGGAEQAAGAAQKAMLWAAQNRVLSQFYGAKAA